MKICLCSKDYISDLEYYSKAYGRTLMNYVHAEIEYVEAKRDYAYGLMFEMRKNEYEKAKREYKKVEAKYIDLTTMGFIGRIFYKKK